MDNVLIIVMWVIFIASLGLGIYSAATGAARSRGWQIGLIIAVLSACVLGLNPHHNSEGQWEFDLSAGLDLKGGTSLLYEVDVANAINPAQAIQDTIQNLSKRVDPDGVRNLAWKQEQGNRIEIQMPLPSPKVLERRNAFEEATEQMKSKFFTRRQLESALAQPSATRKVALAKLVKWVKVREAAFAELQQAYDAFKQAEMNAKGIPDDDSTKQIEFAKRIVVARKAYREQLNKALATTLNMADLHRVLEMSTKLKFDQKIKKPIANSSPRDITLDTWRLAHPDRVADIDHMVTIYDAYAEVKGPLDDPNDLIRMLQGQGVLEFRITVLKDEAPNLAQLRQQLQKRGPVVKVNEPMLWIKIDEPKEYFKKNQRLIDDTLADIEQATGEERTALLANWFGGVLGDVYGGDFYILLWNTKDKSMTRWQPDWAVSDVYASMDDKMFPAISVNLNPRGGVLMGELTRQNEKRLMTDVLDGKALSTATIRGQFSNQFQITGGSGGFSSSEQAYLIRTLKAGSLEAQLSEYPIATRTIGSQYGADNLSRGLKAAVIAIIVVALFMFIYYFFAGLVAGAALFANVVVILGIMAMYKASFTLPGIAGIILTIGMCVDANVLVFERIREELRGGRDLTTALRLGYSKALSAILDGNITNLIVCFILYYTATVEIRGFAVVLGIGIGATLFTSLFMTRVIFAVYNKTVGIKQLNMLPIAFPAIEKLLHPNFNWLGKRTIFAGLSCVAIVISLIGVWSRGIDMLDIEFRAGTEVAFNLKEGQTLKLQEARDRVTVVAQWFDKDADVSKLDAKEKATYDQLTKFVETRKQQLTAEAEADAKDKTDSFDQESFDEELIQSTDLSQLRDATVIAVGDDQGQFEYAGFSVATTVSDSRLMSDVVKTLFGDKLDTESKLSFTGSEAQKYEQAEQFIYPITRADIGSVINSPAVSKQLPDYVGGVAILLKDIKPAATLDDLNDRIKAMRLQPDYQDQKFRQYEVIGVVGSPDNPDTFTSAVVVSKDSDINYFDDGETWKATLASKEWSLVRDALMRDKSLSKVSNFTTDVARTLRDQAIVAMLLSFIAIVAYIWFRFGSLRYGLAAIVALAHDVIITLGLIAASTMLADMLPLIEPYKINLGLIAALLTIVGYSLNDTIVVFDRIRENRGKLSQASAIVINKSINQTVSRTLLTSGTTLLAVLILFLVGSAGIREFAFALIVGVMVGTYSSIAIASPVLSIGLDLSKAMPEPIELTEEEDGQSVT